MSNHTPTPWLFDVEDTAHRRHWAIRSVEMRDPPYHWMPKLWLYEGPGGNLSEEDARHIALCVNSHDDMLAALKTWRTLFDENTVDHLSPSVRNAAKETLSVLARVEDDA